ncbi:2-amino-4-hydroxy-6-hydroxymethyldihydropteridine diphosphokinase [bacterium]|nr:2-amino-4-hydroxy-6-hydroxymethyldihydropteridine diphosphokinase [bacterium]
MSIADPTRVFLGLGSNIGDRKGYLRLALTLIAQLEGTEIEQASSIYETEPWGEPDQDPFYNAAAEIRTTLAPAELLRAVKDIELRMGRVSTRKNGPRIIDIDILLYADSVLDEGDLSIPHPFLAQRNFVLEPLREIAGTLRHPVEHRSIDELARLCKDGGEIRNTGDILTTTG